VNPPEKMITLRRIRPRLTSYEIVCATARRAPINAYLELDAQPEPRMEYTAKLERARINKMLKFRWVEGTGIGIMVHRVRAIVKAKIGEIKKRIGEAVEGRIGSLIKSFTPSAKGWRIP